MPLPRPMRQEAAAMVQVMGSLSCGGIVLVDRRGQILYTCSQQTIWIYLQANWS